LGHGFGFGLGGEGFGRGVDLVFGRAAPRADAARRRLSPLRARAMTKGR